MWLTLPSLAPSSSHHLLIQFPLKNNGFNEGGNKIFRNFIKFCKIIIPQIGSLPHSWICPLLPSKAATSEQILGISWALGHQGSSPSLLVAHLHFQ